MEVLPPEIQTLLREGQLDIAEERLHEFVSKSLTANNYDAIATALVALKSIKQTPADNTDVLVEIVEEALAKARRANDQEWIAHFLQLRLVLNLHKFQTQQDFVEKIHEVVDAYRMVRNINGQLHALIVFALNVASQDPSKAVALHNAAEILLGTANPEQLEQLPKSTLTKIPHTPPYTIRPLSTVSSGVKDQWSIYINQQREQIAKLS